MQKYNHRLVWKHRSLNFFSCGIIIIFFPVLFALSYFFLLIFVPIIVRSVFFLFCLRYLSLFLCAYNINKRWEEVKSYILQLFVGSSRCICFLSSVCLVFQFKDARFGCKKIDRFPNPQQYHEGMKIYNIWEWGVPFGEQIICPQLMLIILIKALIKTDALRMKNLTSP